MLVLVFILFMYVLVIPLEVRLVGENLPLSAGSVYEVACRTFGSKPPPSISWLKAGNVLQVPTRLVVSCFVLIDSQYLFILKHILYSYKIIHLNVPHKFKQS